MTPACLFIASIHTSTLNLPTSEPDKESGLLSSFELKAALPVKSLALTILIAVPSAVLLLPHVPDSYLVGAGLCFSVSLLAIYFIFNQGKHESLLEEQPARVSVPASGTCWRVVVVLTMMLLMPSSHTGTIQVPAVIGLAMVKAVQWIAVTQLV